MPELAITDEMIGAARTRRILGYLESVMLHPEDPERQRQALTVVDHELLEMRARESGNSVLLSPQSLHELRNAPRLSDLSKASQKRFWRGVVMGMIVREAIGRRAIGHPTPSLQHIKAAVAAKMRCSTSTIDNVVMPCFRPVGHLFAAHLELAFGHVAGSGEARFPCRLDELPDFLAIGEWYRLQGEAFLPDYSDTPLLAPDRTYRLPPAIQIQPAPIEFHSR